MGKIFWVGYHWVPIPSVFRNIYVCRYSGTNRCQSICRHKCWLFDTHFICIFRSVFHLLSVTTLPHSQTTIPSDLLSHSGSMIYSWLSWDGGLMSKTIAWPPDGPLGVVSPVATRMTLHYVSPMSPQARALSTCKMQKNYGRHLSSYNGTVKSFYLSHAQHYSDVTWMSWHLKSLATPLLVELFAWAHIKENIKASCY